MIFLPKIFIDFSQKYFLIKSWFIFQFLTENKVSILQVKKLYCALEDKEQSVFLTWILGGNFNGPFIFLIVSILCLCERHSLFNGVSHRHHSIHCQTNPACESKRYPKTNTPALLPFHPFILPNSRFYDQTRL